MDKIEKILSKLSTKEKEVVKYILDKLRENNLLGLNIQKLKEQEDIFRIKKGNIRIIYRKTVSDRVFILAIERRTEKTYKNF